MMISIKDRILKHLKDGGTLTDITGLDLFGTIAARNRISELRKEGHDIRDEWVSSNGKRFKRYFIPRPKVEVLPDGQLTMAGVRA
jgi:hypothetical protein